MVELDLLLDIGGGDGGAKPELEQVDFVGIDFKKIFGLAKAQAFVHDHGQARFAGLGRALRQMRKVVVHCSGFHARVAAGHARVVEQTWVGFQQPIHAVKVCEEQMVEQAQGLSVHPQREQADELFVPQHCGGGWDVLEGIVEQNQCLFVRLKGLHVVHAFLPRFHVFGIALQQLHQAGVRFFMAPHFFQNGGHHQQGVFVVGILQQGCGHVFQSAFLISFQIFQHPVQYSHS